jgi:predicted type IV restriction endonuclease
MVKSPRMNIATVIRQLREERDRIEAAIKTLESMENTAPQSRRVGRKLSTAARRRIAAAQRARWAKVRAAKK